MSQTPDVRRLQLGQELRRLREASGLSIETVAGELDSHRTKVSRYEGGKQSLTIPEVKMLLALFGIVDDGHIARVIDIAKEARKRQPRRVPEWLREFVSLESEATTIQTFDVQLIPGLFQTEAYTRAIATGADPTRDAAEVEKLVAIRRDRQERLTSSSPPQLHLIIHEAAIRCRVGSPDVMREQLAQLLELAKLPKISIQLLPFAAGAHPSMDNVFVILEVPGSGKVVYLEDLWNADYVDKDHQVDAYSLTFDRLCASALDEQGTRAAIEVVMEELR